MSAPVRIGIFASGRGTNFNAIASAIASKKLNAEIAFVLSDRPSAFVLEKALALSLPAIEMPVNGVSREVHEERVLAAIQPFSPHFLVMAGYMRIVTPRLLDAFRSERGYSRIVNIHPSLLPAFPGRDGYAQAFRSGAQTTGVSVHLVDATVDGGPLCAQEEFSIADCKSVEEVEARGLKVEHQLYPQTLSWVLPETFSLESSPQGRFRVRPN